MECIFVSSCPSVFLPVHLSFCLSVLLSVCRWIHVCSITCKAAIMSFLVRNKLWGRRWVMCNVSHCTSLNFIMTYLLIWKFFAFLNPFLKLEHSNVVVSVIFDISCRFCKIYWFTEICSQASNQEYAIVGSDNGQVPNRYQTIIWTNDGILYWHIYGSLIPNELIEKALGFGTWHMGPLLLTILNFYPSMDE